MTRRWLTFFVAGLFIGTQSVSLVGQSRIGWSSITDPDDYILQFPIGIEYWENGQRIESRSERWEFFCTSFEVLTQQPNYCQADRVILRESGPNGTDIFKSHYSPLSNNLQVQSADWKNGSLNLILHIEQGVNIAVNIDFEQVGQGQGRRLAGDLYLTGFLATSQFRSALGTATKVEYRVPEYGYTLDVPIVMPGFKDR